MKRNQILRIIRYICVIILMFVIILVGYYFGSLAAIFLPSLTFGPFLGLYADAGGEINMTVYGAFITLVIVGVPSLAANIFAFLLIEDKRVALALGLIIPLLFFFVVYFVYKMPLVLSV